MGSAFINRRYEKDAQGKRRLVGFEVEWRDADNKRRRKLHDTYAAAKAHRDALNAPKPKGQDATKAPGTKTIAEAARAWIDRVKQDGRARSTWIKYEQRFECHIKPIMVVREDGDEPRPFGDFKLAEVTTPVVVRFKSALQASGRSPVMVQKVMADLRMMLNDAQRAGDVTGNAAAPVRAKRGERHKAPVEIPTPEQVRAILSAVNADDSVVTLGRVWINLLPTTGMRPEETRALGWNYVILDERPAFVRVAWAADELGQIGPPKSKAGYRDIPLTPSCAALLRRWREICPPSPRFAHLGGLVLPTAGGTVFNWSNFHTRIWRPLMKGVGLIRVLPEIDPETGEHLWEPLFTPYALRHWFASFLIRARGNNPKQVQRLMGHENIELTFDIYGHLWADPHDDAKIATGLDRFLLKRA